MRVNNLLGGTFIGVLLILVGLSALLRSFGLNIPFGRIVIGLLIIYVGIAIMVGGGIFMPEDNTILFSGSSKIRVTDPIQDEYNIIFGSGVIDLTDIDTENLRSEIEINTIFGNSEVLLSSNKSVRINASAAFGRAETPNGNTVSFGELNYTKMADEDSNIINLKVAAVFGGTSIRYIE